MGDLARRALRSLLGFQLVLAVLIFGPAGTLDFWQAWLFWLLFGACRLLERHLEQQRPGPPPRTAAACATG